MKNHISLMKEFRKEDFWILPFTGMALILGAYSATTQKPALWWVSGMLIVGMFILTGILVASKYNRFRGILHLAIGSVLLITVVKLALSLTK
jgi:hypothetical protein